MNHMRTKLIVAGLAVAVAVVFLAVAGARGSWVYYVTVDEFLVDQQGQREYQDKRIRINGVVAEENLDSEPGLMTVRFELEGPQGRLPVTYKGVVPDMFRAGSQVVVEGRLDPSGTFQADSLLTKCASKYESDDDAGQTTEHPPTGSTA